jgi:DNA invertase Pin-like site-specific DNA recombinase
MRIIGYARVSTSSQNLDRQIGALRAERCHEVYREKASGKATKGRSQLEKAIDALGRGDVTRSRGMGPRHPVDDGWCAHH